MDIEYTEDVFADIEDDDDAAMVEGGTTTSPKVITGVVMNGLSSGVGLQDEGADPAEQAKKKIGRPSSSMTYSLQSRPFRDLWAYLAGDSTDSRL